MPVIETQKTLLINQQKILLVAIGLDGATIRFTFFHPEVTITNRKSCWWLLAWCSPLPIPNREVKPRTADDTWVKPGKVGSRHNTIKTKSLAEM